jgi:hypothetical protein
VLVYDASTRAIVSPLLTVPELRALGVTLHMPLEAPRDAIPDVSAVYFIGPSQASIRGVIDDAVAGRYRDAALHFCPPIPRPALEALAAGCVGGGAVPRIRSVGDAHLGFTALEHRLFTLNQPDSYAGYACPGLGEGDIAAYARAVAGGLLGVCAASGALPVIVTTRDGPSELVGRALEALLRDAAAPGGVLAGCTGAAHGPGAPALALPGGRRPSPLGLGPGSRPLLLLVDRGLDLATPLAHASGYQALVHDVLGPVALNRVVLPAEGGGKGGAGSGGDDAGLLAAWAGGGKQQAPPPPGKVVSLDADTDPFWRAHAGALFPDAIAAHERELGALVAREAALRRSAASSAASAPTTTRRRWRRRCRTPTAAAPVAVADPTSSPPSTACPRCCAASAPWRRTRGCWRASWRAWRRGRSRRCMTWRCPRCWAARCSRAAAAAGAAPLRWRQWTGRPCWRRAPTAAGAPPSPTACGWRQSTC